MFSQGLEEKEKMGAMLPGAQIEKFEKFFKW